jgi:hypothetical protein
MKYRRGTLMKALSCLTAVALAAGMFSSSLAAQSSDEYHPFLSDKFNIGIGIFYPQKSFKIRVDGSDPEEEIDFDEALRIDEEDTTGSLSFRWRFGEKWSFWGQYWNTDDKGGAILEEDIEWEDVVFKAGTFAAGGVDLTIARAFFGRTFSTGPQHEFGLGAGFHWLSLDTFIEGQVITNFGETEFAREAVSADFPLPNIGGWYMYSWNKKWLFQARLDWLSASVGDYSGGLWNTQAGIHWQAFKHIGFGLFYNGFILDVDVDKDDWNGKAESKQHGPWLAITATW